MDTHQFFLLHIQGKHLQDEYVTAGRLLKCAFSGQKKIALPFKVDKKCKQMRTVLNKLSLVQQ